MTPPGPPEQLADAQAELQRSWLMQLAGLPPAEERGWVNHGLPHYTPPTPTSEPPFSVGPGADVTKMKIAGAKKQKAKGIDLTNITTLSPDVQSAAVARALVADPKPVVLVKKAGVLYPLDMTAQARVVAASIKGDSAVSAKVIDLDKAAPKKKPKNVTPALGDAANILHQHDAGASGSNAGGFYTGADGVKRYVKFYSDASQPHCEHLANAIYNDLGVGAPKSVLFEHEGKMAYASELIAGGKTLADAGITKDRAKDFLKGFVGDVLTGNWDSIGTGNDNAMIAGGRVFRIDNGGTFLFRAKAGRKPAELLATISEWEVFFTSTNPYYSAAAKAAGVSSAEDMKATVVDGIERVIGLRDTAGGWAAYVERTVPTLKAVDKSAVVHMLDARSALLEEKLKVLTGERARTGADVLFNMFDKTNPAAIAVRKKIEAFHADRDYDAFYAKLYSEGGVSDARAAEIKSTIGGWTLEERSGNAHAGVYAAYAKRLLNKGAGSKYDGSLKAAYETRRERWKSLLARVGHPGAEAPTHFDLFRGMSSKEDVVNVAKAWLDGSVKHVTMQHDQLASWSWSTETADTFAKSNGPGVRYAWRAPIEKTVYDQAVDDAAFLDAFYDEHEVIAGPGTRTGLDVEKERAVVHLDGQSYAFKDRDKLANALRTKGWL